MHAAKLSDSPRLQRVLAFLRQRGKAGATGAEFFTECGAMNPGTTSSELKSNGHPCICTYEGKTASGAKVYRYVLGEFVVNPLAPPMRKEDRTEML